MTEASRSLVVGRGKFGVERGEGVSARSAQTSDDPMGSSTGRELEKTDTEVSDCDLYESDDSHTRQRRVSIGWEAYIMPPTLIRNDHLPWADSPASSKAREPQANCARIPSRRCSRTPIVTIGDAL